MKNADLPAHPADQRGAHDIGMGEYNKLPEGHPDRESRYIEAVAKACTGLTKRELFAAMAMQGLAAVPAEGGLKPEYIQTDAKNAVIYADALLAALEKQP